MCSDCWLKIEVTARSESALSWWRVTVTAEIRTWPLTQTPGDRTAKERISAVPASDASCRCRVRCPSWTIPCRRKCAFSWVICRTEERVIRTSSSYGECGICVRKRGSFGRLAALGSLFSDWFPMCSSSIVFSVRVIVWFVYPIVLLTNPTRSYESCWVTRLITVFLHLIHLRSFPL